LPKFLPLNCKKVVEEFLSSSPRSRPAVTDPQLRTDLPTGSWHRRRIGQTAAILAFLGEAGVDAILAFVGKADPAAIPAFVGKAPQDRKASSLFLSIEWTGGLTSFTGQFSGVWSARPPSPALPSQPSG
jgi:hypothetical protein